jgi:hypothetical protein
LSWRRRRFVVAPERFAKSWTDRKRNAEPGADEDADAGTGEYAEPGADEDADAGADENADAGSDQDSDAGSDEYTDAVAEWGCDGGLADVRLQRATDRRKPGHDDLDRERRIARRELASRQSRQLRL